MKLDTLEKLKSSYSEGEKHLIQKTSKEAAMRRLREIEEEIMALPDLDHFPEGPDGIRANEPAAQRLNQTRAENTFKPLSRRISQKTKKSVTALGMGGLCCESQASPTFLNCVAPVFTEKNEHSRSDFRGFKCLPDKTKIPGPCRCRGIGCVQPGSSKRQAKII